MKRKNRVAILLLSTAFTFGALWISLGEEHFNKHRQHYHHHHCEYVDEAKSAR